MQHQSTPAPDAPIVRGQVAVATDGAPPNLHPWTLAAYLLAGETGVLGDQRTELIDGVIYDVAPEGDAHRADQFRAEQALIALAARGLGRFTTVALNHRDQAGRDSQVKPEATLMRPGDYAGGRFDLVDALVVVEVGDATIRSDRTRKAELYARAGVPCYLLVDVAARAVLIHRQPGPNGYESLATGRAGQTIEPLDGVLVRVDELLGP